MARGKISLPYFLYNLILCSGAVVLIPFLAIRGLVKHRPFGAYFRKLSSEQWKRLAGKPVIWIQAVSVGEVIVANIVIKELRRLLPQYALLVTTTTPTGQEMAVKLLGADAVVTYFPIDFPWVVKRFVTQVKPRLFLMMEAEIWPNVIHYCHTAHTKVALVNGLISENAFQRYARFPALMKTILDQVDLFAMQNAEAANRIGQLGAALDRIQVAGNAKFDQAYPEIAPEARRQFLQQYGWSEADRIFVAASTHKGEEPIVIEAYQKLAAETPKFKLILAPRHPDRADEVATLLKEAGLTFVRRSAGTNEETPQVVLLDTFGEFGLAFNVADLVFLGGSLMPIGGHNVLEVAAQSKPVMYGPYMHKTRDSQQLLEEVDAGFTVNDAAEMVAMVKQLSADPVLYQKRGQAARQAVMQNKGSAAQMAMLATSLIAGEQR